MSKFRKASVNHPARSKSNLIVVYKHLVAKTCLLKKKYYVYYIIIYEQLASILLVYLTECSQPDQRLTKSKVAGKHLVIKACS